MTSTNGPTATATIEQKLARPPAPGWRMGLILALAALSLLLTANAIDLVRGVGVREAVLIVITLTPVPLGVWTRARRWSVAAILLAVTAGAFGFEFRADGDLDAMYVGFDGMMQYATAIVLLMTAAALCITEFVHARRTGEPSPF